MNDVSALILQQSGINTSFFTPSSRYFGLEIAVYEHPVNGPAPYVRRRFLPQPERFFAIQEHVVTQGERPDNLTHQYLNDPEQFWRICDANNVMHPNELTDTIGKRIRITFPEGIVPL